jgi:hypothetical protein
MIPEIAYWYGKSGKGYLFEIYPKATFHEIDGNYIFAKKDGIAWKPIYIGEGNLKTRTQDEEHLKCALKKGFTHYHIHSNTNAQARKDEETDLIQGHPDCLVENGGCNETKTGK